jgi:hypothetical protein
MRGQPPRRLADRREIIAPLRQAQERQAAVGVARLEPVERRGGARERGIEGGGAGALGADHLRARGLD